jgi:hypothetical protein
MEEEVMGTVTLRSPQGVATDVPEEDVQSYLDRKFTPEQAVDRAQTVGERTIAAETSPIEAFGQGIGSMVGLDTVQSALGGENARIYLDQTEKARPTASLAGKITGFVAPALVGDFGGGLGLAGDEAGIAGAVARDPVSIEHAAGSLSSKFLFGGEVSEGAGAGLERGLANAGEHLDNLKVASQLPDDLSGLDAAGLRSAKEAELDQLAGAHTAQRTTARSAAVDDMISYQAKMKEANPYLVTLEGSEAKPFTTSTNALRKAMDDVEGLRENPAYLAKPLRIQAQAIERTLAEREAIAAKFDKVNAKIAAGIEEDLNGDVAGLLGKADSVTLEGKAAQRYGSFADVKIPRVDKTPTITLTRDDAQGFLDALHGGEVRGAGQEALGKLEGLLGDNRALQAKIKASTAPALTRTELTSPRLTAINAARDVLATPAGKSLGEDMLSGSIMGHVAGAFSGLPVIGPMIGAKAGQLAKDLVFGRLGKTVAAAGERTKGAIGSFLAVAKTAAPKAAIPLASQVLSRVAYGPSSTPAPKGTQSLPALFKARTDEIKAQTAYGPDGKPVMRQEARDTMAQRLAPIRAASPILADRIETLAAKRLEYLSSIIPRRPDIGGIQIGPDNWKPSDLQMRSFARSMAAAEDPHGVEERLAHGTVTPEDAEAYHAIYPERAEALKQQLLMEMPKLQKNLPYTRRLSLSIFSGVAVDPSLDPRILSALQAQYVAEEGSEGGTEAPKPKPAFGSVKAELGTASQQRAGAPA